MDKDPGGEGRCESAQPLASQVARRQTKLSSKLAVVSLQHPDMYH